MVMVGWLEEGEEGERSCAVLCVWRVESGGRRTEGGDGGRRAEGGEGNKQLCQGREILLFPFPFSFFSFFGHDKAKPPSQQSPDNAGRLKLITEESYRNPPRAGHIR